VDSGTEAGFFLSIPTFPFQGSYFQCSVFMSPSKPISTTDLSRGLTPDPALGWTRNKNLKFTLYVGDPYKFLPILMPLLNLCTQRSTTDRDFRINRCGTECDLTWQSTILRAASGWQRRECEKYRMKENVPFLWQN
jgi:hypothetical protein